jgi:hypothetical protein
VLWYEGRCFVDVTCVEQVGDAGGVSNTGGKENGAECGKKGYIYLGLCNLINILRFVGECTQNGQAFILHNHQALHA